MITTLGELRGLRNVEDITKALGGLSGPKGLLKSYEVALETERRVTLFLELNSPMDEAEVRRVGAYGFGNKLFLDLLVGPRPSSFIAPS